MKGLILGSVALLAIGVNVPAFAADMAVKAPPPAAATAPYNWSGLYVGGNFGGAWTSGNLTIPGNNFFGGLTEFIGGVQAGYNIQAGHFLFGVEGDFTGRLSIIRRFRLQPSALSVNTGLELRQPVLAWSKIVGSSTANWAAAGCIAPPR